MKTLRKLVLIVVVAGGLSFAARNCVNAQDVSVGVSISATADFYAPLTPHGTWVEVGTYGRCWRPVHVEVGWRPYCAGSWVWTDCGWYWQTEEPWGWACYHYGSWMMDPGFGWVWVPGVEWAPAWVEWRVGGGYIGWAPIAPRGVVVVGPMFAFVAVGRFHEPIRRAAIVVNNTTIINQTTIVNNNIRRETRNVGGRTQQVVINNGPGTALVEQATGKKIAATPVVEVAMRTPKPANMKPAGNAGTTARPDNNNNNTRRGGDGNATQPPKSQPGQPHQPRQGQPVQPTQPERGRGDGQGERVTQPDRGHGKDGRDGGGDQPDRPRDEQPDRPDGGGGHGNGHGRGGGGGGVLTP